MYPTDVAKMVQSPIFHVNGDDPEACVRVARLAFAYPPDVPQGRRRRPRLLPPARPQRGRRPELHPAAHVQEDRRAPLGAHALHRGARRPRRHHRRRGRTGRSPTSTAACSRRSTRRVRRRRRDSTGSPTPDAPPKVGRLPARPASTRALLGALVRRARRHAGGLHASTRSSPASSTSAARSRGRARSTGPSPRRSPSAACCSRGPTFASRARTPRRGTFSQRHAVLVDYATGAEFTPLARSASGRR